MGDSLGVKIAGVNETSSYFNSLAILAPEKLSRIILKAVKLGESKAKENCTVGVSGSLRQSIHGDLDSETQGTIGVYSQIAPYVEYGTIPHMPPVEALENWADKVLGDEEAAWPVAIKIRDEGTPPQPFLFPAMEDLRSEYTEMLKQGLKDILK